MYILHATCNVKDIVVNELKSIDIRIYISSENSEMKCTFSESQRPGK